jgi:hypothetical protein
MPRAIEHPVKAHGGVPIEPVHDFRQILRLCGFEQVMDVIAHYAQSIQLETKLLQRFFERIEKHLPAFPARQAKLTVIAASGDVVAVSGLKRSGLAGHQLFSQDLRKNFTYSEGARQCAPTNGGLTKNLRKFWRYSSSWFSGMGQW